MSEQKNQTRTEPSQKRFQSMIRRIMRSRVTWAMLGVVLMLVTLRVVTSRTAQVQAQAHVPADLFMQSVVMRDGNLGWHQLCSDARSQVSLSELVSTTTQQRRAETSEGLRLTLSYVGADAQPQRGQIRVYVMTAHLPSGWAGQRTYIVYTQASGCVEDVKNI